MSGSAQSTRPTGRPDLDRAVADVKSKAVEFARLPVREKAALVRALAPRIVEVAHDWVRAACRAKGLAPDGPTAGEEWLAGPDITLRNTRLLAESLDAIAERGKPPLGRGARVRADGRLEVSVFPTSGFDSALFGGFSARVLMQPGVSETSARERQAAFYGRRDAKGGVTLVLGAGNVAAIPPTDVLYKMFVDGNVCVLKMNPVNEWVGPFLERALAPLTERGYVRIVYGGGDVGAYLVAHPDVDDVHITGSDRTHDLIVWGPPGPERERRRKAKDPLLKKTITSELGNVSPVCVVPADYSDDELWFQARSVTSMVVNNGSFNCNAGKVLVLGKGWSQRDKFVGMIRRALAQAPLRKAYYPGAQDRYQQLLGGRGGVEKFGQPAEGELAWAFVPGLEASNRNEKLFEIEPFCGILSETAIASTDPVGFLSEATAFCNDRLWGTLNACIVIHPRHEKDSAVGQALDRAIVELRYGTVAINHWPAVGYGLVSPPWGGHPSATLENIQSGLGWVHNTYMLEGIDKAVVRGPLLARPKPAWFFDNRQTHRIGEKLVAFEAAPSWLKVPGLAVRALQG
ncbi:MAG TPA: aldehyde dehydrogenase family protein [Polyangia bacterium]|nr:aldehyde dehydrogenase family protein [Polyangia bacterium]